MEEGVIVKMKDTFGFIGCFDRDGGMFFHLSDAPGNIAIGDEVRFAVTQNPRSGKYVAMRIQKLNDATTASVTTAMEGTALEKENLEQNTVQVGIEV